MAKSKSHLKPKSGRTRQAAPAPVYSAKLFHTLKQARVLLARARYAEVARLLAPLEPSYPHSLELLTTLAVAKYHLNDRQDYLRLALRVVELDPDDPHNTLALASAYLRDARPALGLLTFRRFLAEWPKHKEAAKVREDVRDLEEKVPKLLAEVGLTGEEGLELAALHEQVLVTMQQGEFARSLEHAEELMARAPRFVSPINNYCQVLFLSGETEKAVAAAQRVLAIDEDNFHALGNLTHYLYLDGRVNQAWQYANRLRALTPTMLDTCLKQAEAGSFLGDDAAVLAAYRTAEERGWIDDYGPSFLLCHYAAVAAARLGEEARARKLWAKSLQYRPGFDLARQNLADINQTVGRRNGPWAFQLGSWFSKKCMDDLRAAPEESDHPLTAFLAAHPEVLKLAPTLLERGGPDARKFILELAGAVRTPELLALLRDFTFSQNGTDQQRTQASSICSEAGLLEPGGMVRMWLRGEWSEVMMMGWELHDEPTESKLSPRALELLEQGINAMNRADLAGAERSFRQALALHPDDPSLINNLAATRGTQGHHAESERLIEELHRKHPDYLFARANLASRYAKEGDIDRALELLKPVLTRKRLHFTELGALCSAQIEIALAQKEPDAARAWFDVIERSFPDYPQLEQLRARLAGPGILEALRRLRR